MGKVSAQRQGQRKGDFLAGKYLLEECLGVGGMGEVYRATNVSLGRKVAIKLLAAEYANIEDDVLRFLREARAAAAIRHSNVVDVIDVARDDDGTPFIVQELLAGEDLERYLKARRGPISWEEALEIMIPVADAVAAAHAENVVHRDLKPANIFLARERNRITPKVLDFGACLFPTLAERSAKEVRMLIGTPNYMAPEQIVSKRDVDSRSDVWALGLIFYEMLVGQTPFEAETVDAVLELVKTRDVPPVRQHAPQTPAEVEAIIARCTKRERMERYPNAGALHAELTAVRDRVRGVAASSRMPTLLESSVDGPHAPEAPPASAPRFAADSLDLPFDLPPSAPPAKRPLLTLSSPGSLPPASADSFGEAPLSSMDDLLGPGKAVTESTPPRSHGSSGMRELEPSGDLAGPAGVELAARPSSWPPARKNSARPAEPAKSSSLPPVLDPRALAAMPGPIDSAPLPRDATGGSGHGVGAAAMPRPPAVVARASSASLPSAPPRSAAPTAKIVAFVGVPALVAFAGVLFVPALASPIGHALRGDSTVASGVLAVVALVFAAAVCARSMLGERRKWLYVAAAGAVLFGIVMIIVTFAASEAAELGVPQSMAGLSTTVAPIAPLVLAVGALVEARALWTDPYSRSEAVRSATLASVMLFVAFLLSPVGAARTVPEPQAQHSDAGG